jgi:photosystem II stability/assembly factor-like uncharacterized protein
MKGSSIIVVFLMCAICAEGWEFPEPSTPDYFGTPNQVGSSFFWEWTGPEGGVVYRIVVDPATPEKAYAVTLMDIWRTSDGSNWQLIDEFKYRGEQAIVAVGADRAIAAVNDGLWYTPNAGASWSSLMSFDEFECMSEASSETVLVVYWDDTLRLVETVDGGFSWDTLGVLAYQSAYAIEPLPGSDSTIFLGVEMNDTVFLARSTDRGASWETVWRGDTLHIGGVADIEVNPWREEEIFVSFGMESDGPVGLLYSTDGGDSWGWLLSSATYGILLPIDVEFMDENTIFVANQMEAGIFEGARVPSPEQWVFTPLYSETGATSIHIINADSIWAGTVAGVIRSTDGGARWAEVNSGLKAFTALSWYGGANSSVSLVAHDTMYVVNGFGNPVYRTGDGGQTWHRVLVPNLILNVCVEVCRATPDTAYLGGLGVSETGKQWVFHSLYRTSDGGENWIPVDTLTAHSPDSLAFYSSLWVSPTDSRILLATVDEEMMLRSTDGGYTWDTLFTFLQHPPTGTETVFVQEADYIRVSYDSGENWNPLLLVTTAVRAMSYNPLSGNLFAVWGDSLYRVSLSGEATPLLYMAAEYLFINLDAERSNKTFLSYHDIGTSTSCLLRSFDYGATFQTDTVDIMPVVLRVGNNELIMGDLGKSFWRSEEAFTYLSESPAMERVIAFKILPVPFTNRLTIQITSEKDVFTDIALYDLAGRKVGTVLKGMCTAGSGRFEYDTKRLAQGVYFYTARIGEKSYRGKIIKISP